MGEQLSNDIPHTNATPESYFTAFDRTNSALFCFNSLEISELETLRLLLLKHQENDLEKVSTWMSAN
jgi:hypothetical protein